MTAAVVVLLFLGWQLWLNDFIAGGKQTQEATTLGQDWSRSSGGSSDKPSDPGTPIVRKEPATNTKFAILIVPRWGNTWQRPIAQGIGVADVLDTIGVGHYPGTQMPGEIGNFAIAGHRLAYGHAMRDVYLLRVGDPIYVETRDGWYRYVFRNLHYVLPNAIQVLQPVPEQPGVKPTERYITLTTCNPFYSTAERIAAYGLFDRWYPRAEGPPPELAALTATKG
jgi:sortase A